MTSKGWIGTAVGLLVGAAVATSLGTTLRAESLNPVVTRPMVRPDPLVTNDSAFMAVFSQQYKAAFGEGAIPAKYKQLSGATLSVMVKCEECLVYHVQMAIKQGARRQEIVEALRIGLLAGGSAGMPTMGAAYMVMDSVKLK